MQNKVIDHTSIPNERQYKEVQSRSLNRRERREKVREWKKKYPWIANVDVGKEYIKMVLGESDLSELRQRQLTYYIQERRAVDGNFSKGMEIVDTMIENSIKNNLKIKSEENKIKDESSNNC